MFIIEKETCKSMVGSKLSTGTKRKVVDFIKAIHLRLDCRSRWNILSIGSYDVLLGMDWLASHKEKINIMRRF
jgi:hypothetical protein